MCGYMPRPILVRVAITFFWGKCTPHVSAEDLPIEGRDPTCADGATCLHERGNEEEMRMRGEFLQHRHNLDSSTEVVSKVSPIEMPVPITWFHAARTGTSFLYTLLQLEQVCGESAADVCSWTDRCSRSPVMSTVWQRCKGLQQSRRCGGGDHVNECAEAGLGDEYPQLEGKLMGFFRQPEQRLLSDYTWDCGGGREDTLDDMANSWCPPLQTFLESRQGCVTKMLTWTGDIAAKVSMHCNTPGWVPNFAQVEVAKQRLTNDFAFIGMTDQWDLSICLFNTMFGTTCHANQFMAAATATNQTTAVYDTDILEGFVDQYDAELFDVAQSIFNDNLGRFGVSEETCKPCFD